MKEKNPPFSSFLSSSSSSTSSSSSLSKRILWPDRSGLASLAAGHLVDWLCCFSFSTSPIVSHLTLMSRAGGFDEFIQICIDLDFESLFYWLVNWFQQIDPWNLHQNLNRRFHSCESQHQPPCRESELPQRYPLISLIINDRLMVFDQSEPSLLYVNLSSKTSPNRAHQKKKPEILIESNWQTRRNPFICSSMAVNLFVFVG